MKNEIILYQPNELSEHIEVRFEENTVWLTQQQMVCLFNRTKQNISLHINKIFNEGELKPNSVVKEYLTTALDGKNYQTKYYNLDVIISVGYRVKSPQGTQFRIWATEKLRDYLLRGYVVEQRFERLESRVTETENQIGFFVKTALPPTQGIFFDGQVFDAYNLASNIIRSAQHNIILIDNYIDDNTLLHLAKKNSGVRALLLTQSISPQLALDAQKADAQYGGFEVKQFSQSHDRFLIIDSGKDVYHIGASLKDLGKKWFAFSKMSKESVCSIINAISGLM
ncbi:MAG: virulence RhuM family protein [Oscillospiraceae bacterium]|nr:virulence RhuM family protein [Oscillospiraceae bacterium]